jgi:hypothetical protein
VSASPAAAPSTGSTRSSPWWVPGLVLGMIVAATTAVVAEARRPGVPEPLPDAPTHKAEAFVQLPPKGIELVNTGADEARYRSRQIFLLTARELIVAVLKEPDVAGLDTVKQATDSVAAIGERLAVTVVADDILRVTLTGTRPNDMKVILDRLVKEYVDETSMADRKERDYLMRKLEQRYENLLKDIEGWEHMIKLVSANRQNFHDDGGPQLALLERRLADVDAEHTQIIREIGRWEAELKALKQKDEEKKDATPDPARHARLNQLATLIKEGTERRERLKADRVALQKLVNDRVRAALDIELLRDELKPRRELLGRVNAHIEQLGLAAKVDAHPSVRGEVVVTPMAAPSPPAAREGRATAVGVPAAAAFVVGFVLATGFCLVGLIFRILRKWA